MDGNLNLFVYGTLKRGCVHHDTYCRGAFDVREATIRGRLFAGPGYPMLEIPERFVLARGSGDYAADMDTQARLAAQGESFCPAATCLTSSDWGTVPGEVLTFVDAASRLQAIDDFEDFHPGGRSLYLRLLAPVATEDGDELAWVYVASGIVPLRQRILHDTWVE